jgi:hypothetical protein
MATPTVVLLPIWGAGHLMSMLDIGGSMSVFRAPGKFRQAGAQYIMPARVEIDLSGALIRARLEELNAADLVDKTMADVGHFKGDADRRCRGPGARGARPWPHAGLVRHAQSVRHAGSMRCAVCTSIDLKVRCTSGESFINSQTLSVSNCSSLPRLTKQLCLSIAMDD